MKTILAGKSGHALKPKVLVSHRCLEVYSLHDEKGGSSMKTKDVKEAIFEALELYIDEISVIDNVQALPDGEDFPTHEGLVITLKDRDQYRLLITQRCEA